MSEHKFPRAFSKALTSAVETLRDDVLKALDDGTAERYVRQAADDIINALGGTPEAVDEEVSTGQMLQDLVNYYIEQNMPINTLVFNRLKRQFEEEGSILMDMGALKNMWRTQMRRGKEGKFPSDL